MPNKKCTVYTVDGREVRALTKLHANGTDAAWELAIDKGLGAMCIWHSCRGRKP
ncbi:MAG: hypothetical protein IIY37_05140 [Selenomonadaceae bacterium]|nr:hypothetical protein [Selenomonadaceae bacterium]MBQ1510697.1 hypothetical protein [Selenomonadaceae bacterium]MBQ1914350.1 hypothetical protein [Selenomonadaceae bacterium]MBQ3971106.1 hypothetical protein [Selenomonadaceae bacterium]